MRLIYLFFLFSLSYDIFANENRFSQEEIKSFYNYSDFDIISGKLYINNFGHFADGNYLLKSVDIEERNEYIYKVSLVFRLKKKRYLTYTKHITLDIFSKDKKFWIKYRGKIYKYIKPNRYEVSVKKGNATYTKYKIDNLHVKMKNLSLVITFN